MMLFTFLNLLKRRKIFRYFNPQLCRNFIVYVLSSMICIIECNQYFGYKEEKSKSYKWMVFLQDFILPLVHNFFMIHGILLFDVLSFLFDVWLYRVFTHIGWHMKTLEKLLDINSTTNNKKKRTTNNNIRIFVWIKNKQIAL